MDSGIAVIQALQVSLPNLGPAMQAIAFLGQPEFYLLVIPLVYWCYDRSLGLRLALLVAISGSINDTLKIGFHTPRPYWVSHDVKALTNYPTFGLPSGHAQNALVFFGYIAVFFRKLRVWIVCILIILLIGLARVYQAMHFPSDVIAGWLAGLLILLVFIGGEKPVAAWIGKKPAGVQVSLVFLSSLALIGLTQLALMSLGSWIVPADWATTALAQTGVPIDPLAPRDTYIAAGLLFGAATGAILTRGRPGMEIPEGASRKSARYLVGIVILFAIWLIFSNLVQLPAYEGYTVTYVRSALAGLWIFAGAPYLFLKAGRYMARRHPDSRR